MPPFHAMEWGKVPEFVLVNYVIGNVVCQQTGESVLPDIPLSKWLGVSVARLGKSGLCRDRGAIETVFF